MPSSVQSSLSRYLGGLELMDYGSNGGLTLVYILELSGGFPNSQVFCSCRSLLRKRMYRVLVWLGVGQTLGGLGLIMMEKISPVCIWIRSFLFGIEDLCKLVCLPIHWVDIFLSFGFCSCLRWQCFTFITIQNFCLSFYFWSNPSYSCSMDKCYQQH